MDELSTSVLQRAALESGLLSQAQLDEALASLRGEYEGQQLTTEVADHPLADRLVELGFLNRWQVDQLLQGHRRFKLGPYRIVDAIGKGGMGHVFKGEHELLGRIEAIKVLPVSKSTPQSIQSFQREIRAQAQLDHPNLVRVSYADNDGDTHFLVTEYVPGTDLRRLVRRHGPVPLTVAATIVAQVAEALHFAHRKGLVHRDVKPGNVLVTPEGRVKITDLGLAWYLMEDIGPVAGGKPGTIVGTSDYLAPEAISDPASVRPVSDIYSLGCTLYYAVTGKVPFPGGKTSDKMRRHLEETPLNPLHFNPDLPPEFCDVIERMMEKDPDRRVPTADKVVELLHPWCSADIAAELASVTERVPGQRGRQTATVPPGLAETATYEVDDMLEALPGNEASNQVFEGTEPLRAASEDTVKVTHESNLPLLPQHDPDTKHIHWGLQALIVVALASAIWSLLVMLF